MNQRLLGRTWPAVILVVSVTVLAGCAAAVAPSQPSASPIQQTLTALMLPVQISRPGSGATSLNQDDTVVVGINDQIEVPESGHAVVQIGDRLTVDLLRSSDFALSEVRREPGDAIFANLRQIKGHSHVVLDENANVRVRLDTDFASITTLEPGTEFLVCHDPTLLTCLVVQRGEVEVIGQAKVVRVEAGEGTYILKDQSPFSPICADLAEVDSWLNDKLGSGPIEALGELVAGWEQESCAAATAEAPAATAVAAQPQPLPLSEGMIRIDAGTYTIGSTLSSENHVPPMEKEVPAFWIDIYEVTSVQYAAFLDQAGRQPPVHWPGKDKHPVAGVTWDDAVAYCTWANKRLPTEVEWEVAARGPNPDPPSYPWGDDPGANGRAYSLPRTETYEVGRFPFTMSAAGAYDMAGNVWEWVGDPYYPVAEGMKVLRGGRYGFIVDMAYRQETEPGSERFVPYAGFRCAADRVQGE